MRPQRRRAEPCLTARAIRARQGAETDVYLMFLSGRDLLRIADISRLNRQDLELKGFQRGEIKRHIAEIVEYLDAGPSLFPNAVILAISGEARFKESRGPIPAGASATTTAGVLSLPLRDAGTRIAWIVDGQQRATALARTANGDIAVPVVAFVSDDIAVHRQQFILVNKAKPLPSGLIDELLPEVPIELPKSLSARKLPSIICNALNTSTDSPFEGIIKRESDPAAARSYISDTAVMKMISESLKSPSGLLAQYKKPDGEIDASGMVEALCAFWSHVRQTFGTEWSLPPSKSRLTHAAGIAAMGALMDQISVRAEVQRDPQREIADSLSRLAVHCRWTSGTWEGIGVGWQEIQNTPQDIKKLTNWLTRLDRELARGRK